MNDNKKSKVWVYAVILFTSAFIVLLLTAYSQIKLNKNLDNYKTQAASNETEKKKVQQGFSSAQEMNAKLNEEIKRLQDENAALKAKNDELAANITASDEKTASTTQANDKLSASLMSYMNGNITECAQQLDQIDASALVNGTAALYSQLQQKVYPEAGKLLFKEGYTLYIRAKYSQAVEKLALSFRFAPQEPLSDKYLYYLANAEMKNGDEKSAVEHMNKLIQEYPKSTYLRSAKRFVQKYQK